MNVRFPLFLIPNLVISVEYQHPYLFLFAISFLSMHKSQYIPSNTLSPASTLDRMIPRCLFILLPEPVEHVSTYPTGRQILFGGACSLGLIVRKTYPDLHLPESLVPGAFAG